MDHESPVGFPGLLSLATLRFVPLVDLLALPLLVRGLAAIARPRTATIPGLPMQALTPRLNPSITPMTNPCPSRLDLPTSSRSLCMISPLLPGRGWRRWREAGMAAAATAPKADRHPRPSSQMRIHLLRLNLGSYAVKNAVRHLAQRQPAARSREGRIRQHDVVHAALPLRRQPPQCCGQLHSKRTTAAQHPSPLQTFADLAR